MSKAQYEDANAWEHKRDTRFCERCAILTLHTCDECNAPLCLDCAERCVCLEPCSPLEKKIRQRIANYKDWSRAERRTLDAVTDEILDHCKNGTGNGFIKTWCDKFLADLFC